MLLYLHFFLFDKKYKTKSISKEEEITTVKNLSFVDSVTLYFIFFFYSTLK